MLNLLFSIVYVAITIAVFVLLLHKVDAVIKFLKLEDGFDDELIVFGDLDDKKIIKFAVLLIGGFLIIDNIPIFLKFLYLTAKWKISKMGLSEMEKMMYNYPRGLFTFIISAVNIIVGYALITNYRVLANKWGKKD
ncbi:hypothetical protein ACG2LH_15490 [Zhouia sp. PK063]|uniref:hypothetical protein n=1 Tax=Zhouia sp. PK063 TaxID=3373602 RepID=UPI00379A9625